MSPPESLIRSRFFGDDEVCTMFEKTREADAQVQEGVRSKSGSLNPRSVSEESLYARTRLAIVGVTHGEVPTLDGDCVDYEPTQPVVMIGSGVQCDFRIQDRTISNMHARLHLDGEYPRLEVLARHGSTYGPDGPVESGETLTLHGESAVFQVGRFAIKLSEREATVPVVRSIFDIVAGVDGPMWMVQRTSQGDVVSFGGAPMDLTLGQRSVMVDFVANPGVLRTHDRIGLTVSRGPSEDGGGGSHPVVSLIRKAIRRHMASHGISEETVRASLRTPYPEQKIDKAIIKTVNKRGYLFNVRAEEIAMHGQTIRALIDG